MVAAAGAAAHCLIRRMEVLSNISFLTGYWYCLFASLNGEIDDTEEALTKYLRHESVHVVNGQRCLSENTTNYTTYLLSGEEDKEE